MEKTKQIFAKTTTQSIISLTVILFCFWNLSFNSSNIDDATKQFMFGCVTLILGFYFVNAYKNNQIKAG